MNLQFHFDNQCFYTLHLKDNIITNMVNYFNINNIFFLSVVQFGDESYKWMEIFKASLSVSTVLTTL